MSMETGFLSLILCDLLFIKIKLSVRKHNLFVLWYSYCSTSSLSCINARLCLSYRVCQANSAQSADLTATFVPKFSQRHWFLPSEDQLFLLMVFRFVWLFLLISTNPLCRFSPSDWKLHPIRVNYLTEQVKNNSFSIYLLIGFGELQ